MITTTQEDSKIHQLKKRMNSYDLGTTAEIVGHMHFLYDILIRVKAEAERLQRENEDFKSRLKFQR